MKTPRHVTEDGVKYMVWEGAENLDWLMCNHPQLAKALGDLRLKVSADGQLLSLYMEPCPVIQLQKPCSPVVTRAGSLPK